MLEVLCDLIKHWSLRTVPGDSDMNSNCVNGVDARTSVVPQSIRLIFTFFLVLALAGCNGDKVTLTTLSGNATYPPEFRGSLGAVEPVANEEVNVLDLSRGPSADPVAIAATDSNGNYLVSIPSTSAVAVIVLGDVRVSGLIDTRNGSVGKSFNGITDVACQAGVTAIGEGTINAADLTAERIQVLEQTAAIVITQINVDYTDADGSLTAAANRVRVLSDDGDHLPQ